MNKQTLLIIGFVLMVLAQWAIPGQMILNSENVIAKGKEWRFRTAPADPNDPFRGKYITLRFEDNKAFNMDENLKRGDDIYVTLGEDFAGFAVPNEVYSYPPSGADYVKAKVLYGSPKPGEELFIEYPFNRFYMDEEKAYPAELAYRESSRDPNSTAWAVVRIKDGNPILLDVLIDGIPIAEVVEEQEIELE